MRFVVYGRVESRDGEAAILALVREAEDYARGLGGTVDAEFFEIDVPGVVPWPRRPKARRLLHVLRDPRAGIDAVVVPNPETSVRSGDLAIVRDLLALHEVELHLVGHGRVEGGDRRIRALERTIHGRSEAA